jgi:tight adherence protein B
MQAILTPLIYVLAFLFVVVIVQTSAGVIFAASDRARRVNRRLTMLDSGMSREDVYAALVRIPVGTPTDLQAAALVQRYRSLCRQAGLSMSPERLAILTAGAAAILWVLALLVSKPGNGFQFIGNAMVSLFAAIGVTFGGVWIWLTRMRTARQKRIEEQLPTALDIINRALRAGHPVISAIQLSADEMNDPIGSEFGLIVDEATYGVNFDAALTNFARRTGSQDAHFFAVSVSIQADTGGNLAEILGGLATVIRGRTTLAKRVRAVASEGRASALLLSALPIGVVLVQLLIHAHVYTDKFSDPIFWPAVFITAAVYGIGWVMIYRIINFRY